MKVTVELEDVLYRRLKAEAALQGRKVKELITEGIRTVLATSKLVPEEFRTQSDTGAPKKSSPRSVVNSDTNEPESALDVGMND